MMHIIWDDYRIEFKDLYNRRTYRCRTRWGWKSMIRWVIMHNTCPSLYIKAWMAEDSKRMGRHIFVIEVHRKDKG